MSWQPNSVDEVHEEDRGIVAPRAMKLVAKYHLEKAVRIVAVLSALQEVHGAMAENVIEDADKNTEGDQVLDLLSVTMMLLGMVLMKVLQKCWSRMKTGSEEDLAAMRPVRVQSTGTSSMSRPTALEEGATSSMSRPMALERGRAPATTRPTARSRGPSMAPSEAQRRARVRSLPRKNIEIKDHNRQSLKKNHRIALMMSAM